jgi:GTP-binding protein HflX
VLVFNKIDAMDPGRQPLSLADHCEVTDAATGRPRRLERVFASARTGEGLATLRELLAGRARQAALPLETDIAQGESPALDFPGD